MSNSLLSSSSKSQLLQCVPLITLTLLGVPQPKTQHCAILSPGGADSSVLLLRAAFFVMSSVVSHWVVPSGWVLEDSEQPLDKRYVI